VVSWQFGNMSIFCDISFQGKRQIVGSEKKCPVRGLICVFVELNNYGEDRFYICPWLKLRDIMVRRHREYIARCKGARPKKWDSLHGGIGKESLSKFENKWDVIEEHLK
jgi:hypothetical protein